MIQDLGWYKLVVAVAVLVSLVLLALQVFVPGAFLITSKIPFLTAALDVELRSVTEIPVFSFSESSTSATFGTKISTQSTGLLVQQEALGKKLTAQAAVAVDVDSATVLFEKNAYQSLYPASTVKLMTALVAREVYQLGDKVTVLEEVNVEGNTADLKLGEVLTVENTLKALLISSGNDAALVLAYSHPQGPAAFIEAMNKKSSELGLTQTLYENSTGLDQYDQLTSARDLAIVARAVLLDPVLSEIVATKESIIADERQLYTHRLINTNALLEVLPGVKGMKTGTTPFAKEALITVVERDGHEVVFVVLGSRERYNDTKQLVSWVFDHYNWYPFSSQELKALLD